jgi:hypothetical protein
MKPLPLSLVRQEKLRDLEASRQILAMWVRWALEGKDYPGHLAPQIAWWKDYVEKREKELEDEHAA